MKIFANRCRKSVSLSSKIGWQVAIVHDLNPRFKLGSLFDTRWKWSFHKIVPRNCDATFCILSKSRQQPSLIIQKYPTISAKITIRIIDQGYRELLSVLEARQTRSKNPAEPTGHGERRVQLDVAGTTGRGSRFLAAEVAFETCPSNKWR